MHLSVQKPAFEILKMMEKDGIEMDNVTSTLTQAFNSSKENMKAPIPLSWLPWLTCQILEEAFVVLKQLIPRCMHSLIMGTSRNLFNQAVNKGMVSASNRFTPTISSTVRPQIPIQPTAMSKKPIVSPPKKGFPSRPLSRVFRFSLAFAAFSYCSSPFELNATLISDTH
ncbi:hypothetical protein Pint_08416 [Pistacia integerrima]|uniref:Uncharacterized protein n=1 Tax=Pistacia integerrima TaxID=434235 RepID=A0ACC0XSY2_9ROSI|nr:hypothetical protein Pint_08416 [Pistacia integerrima]